MAQKERRSARRYGLKLPLVIRWRQEPAPAEISTETIDVSSHGIYFFLAQEVKKGSAIEVVMTLPPEITMASPVRVRCLGRVQRLDRQFPQKVGVAAVIERYEFVRGTEDAA